MRRGVIPAAFCLRVGSVGAAAVAVQDYSELRRLTAAGIRGLDCPSATAALAALEPEATEATPALDQHLLQRSREHGDAAALLCLRCRVSHPLEAWLKATTKQWCSRGVELIALASYALDDDGQLQWRTPDRGAVPFVFAELAADPSGVIRPFTAEVIRTYDPVRCGLPHWSRQRIQAHNGLQAYLREHGVLLISDWALLRHSSLLRTRDACTIFGVSAMALTQALELKRRYDPLYDDAKKAYKDRTGKGSGWQPDQAFLSQLAPGQESQSTSEQLREIARAIRKLLTGQVEISLTTAEGQELDLPAPAAEHDQPDSQPQEQLALIEKALQRALDQHMPSVLAGDGKTPELMRCLWQGWADGLTNRPLADRCGTSCGTVSRKLRPTEHAAAIATAAALELRRHPAFASCSSSVEAAERLVEALKNHLLEPKQEGDIAPLRRSIQIALQ